MIVDNIQLALFFVANLMQILGGTTVYSLVDNSFRSVFFVILFPLKDSLVFYIGCTFIYYQICISVTTLYICTKAFKHLKTSTNFVYLEKDMFLILLSADVIIIK